MKKILLVAAVLVTFSHGSFAQSVPGAPGWVNGWINTWADLLGGAWHSSIAMMECQNGHFFSVTYRVYDSGPLAGTQIPIEAQDTGEPCDCSSSGGGGSARPQAATGLSSLHPRETNCTSDNGMGQQDTVPGQEAAGSTSSWGGPSSFGSGSGPAPLLELGSFSNKAPRLPPRAAAPGSTFTFTVSFRDLPSGPLLAEVTSPVAWACNSNLNPTMFRVFHVTDTVTRINLCTGQAVATINVPDLPFQVRVTPDGSQAIVTSFSGAITFINTATNMVTGSIKIPTDPNFAPAGIAISPDGSYALVTNYPATTNVAYSYLAVVNIASMQITGKIPLAVEGPESVFINPDGTLAWVTHPWDNAVEVVDILTGTVVQEPLIFEPFSIVFNPTGTRAFVSSGTGAVQVIDTSTYQVIKSVAAGAGAMDLQITPDGAIIYVNNSLAQSITVIDTQSLQSTTTTIGAMPQGAALVPSQ
jgi:YVTN family beta-propeller protein